jgi:hypothetical protein
MAEELARRVLRSTTRLALTGVTAGLGAWAATAGARQVLKRRADEALQIAAQTPLGRVLPEPDVPDDGAEQEAANIAEAVRGADAAVRRTLREAASDTPLEAVTDEAEPEATSGELPPPTAAEIGAPGVATEAAEAAVEQLQREHSVPAEPTRADLPIADFDSVSIASLRARLRRLDLEGLVILREWETAHAHRLPVITMLDNRIAKVQAGQG